MSWGQWNVIKQLVDEDDSLLTEVGLSCKQLAIRMKDKGYELTEEDLEIIDSSWMAFWKEK